ncbi:hypothetical protein [Nakamurella antarctica]|uniref:hypothetical protein n=1 Tax=Nakamurella antarctica TaxID=1902245 RepID=UPI0013DE575D|nr:hypothetical protein [Nakamurella antarctica]
MARIESRSLILAPIVAERVDSFAQPVQITFGISGTVFLNDSEARELLAALKEVVL